MNIYIYLFVYINNKCMYVLLYHVEKEYNILTVKHISLTQLDILITFEYENLEQYKIQLRDILAKKKKLNKNIK